MKSSASAIQRDARRVIDPNVSIVLDWTRFFLAFGVAAGHWTQASFQDTWPDLTRIGVASVGGFFVLSGFTIRMLSSTRSFVFGQFVVDRFSRLWSVVLPALLLTAILDFASHTINAPYYVAHWAADATHPVGRLLLNATFLSQFWGHDVSPLSNSPAWSLSYEAWFYVLFGLFMARRPIWLVIGVVLAGPNILYLMVLWLIGVGVFELFERAKGRTTQILLCVVSGLATLVACVVSIRYQAELFTFFTALQDACLGVFGVGPGRVSPGKVIGGLIVAAGLLASLSLARLLHDTISTPAKLVQVSRTIGDFTFPLYLLHFPLFVLCGALGFYDRHSAFQKIAVFAVVCSVIFAVAPLTQTFKTQLRPVMAGAMALARQRVPQWARGSAADGKRDGAGSVL